MKEMLADKPTVLSTAMLSLAANCAFSFGLCLETQQGLFENIPLLIGCFIGASILFFLALSLLWRALDRVEQKRLEAPPARIKHAKRGCFISFAVIFACWIPILLAGWPGFFAYDSGISDPLMQWSQIESGTLNAHHSILHTAFVASTILAGQSLFGSFNAGVCTSVVIQALIVASLLAYSLSHLEKSGLGRAGFVLATAYFALHPIIALFAFCTTKDTLFSALAIAYCINLMNLQKTPPQSIRKRQVATLALIGFLLCILRANAIVALVVLTPLAVIALRGRARKAFAISIACALALSFIWLKPISAAIGIESSPIGSWNALGIPMQQIALCENSPDVSAEDKASIEGLFGKIGYKQNNSDIARDSFCWQDGARRNLASVYFKLGLKYPSVFLEAALLHTEDAWSPFAVIDAYNQPGDGWTSVFDYRTMEPGTMEPLLPNLSQALKAFSSSESVAAIPGVNLLTSIPLYLLAMLVCLARAISKRDRAVICFCLPLAVLALSNFFGPCMLIRYFLYLFYALPACLFFLVRPQEKDPLQLSR